MRLACHSKSLSRNLIIAAYHLGKGDDASGMEHISLEKTPKKHVSALSNDCDPDVHKQTL